MSVDPEPTPSAGATPTPAGRAAPQATPPAAPGPGFAGRWQKRFRRVVVLLFFLGVALVLFPDVFLAGLVRDRIRASLEATTGGRVDIDAVRLSVVRGLTIEGLRCFEPGAAPDASPAIAVERFTVDVGWLAALAGDFVITRGEARGVMVNAVRERDGTFSLARLSSHPSADVAPGAAPPNGGSFDSFTLTDIHLADVTIAYRDEALGIGGQITGLDFSVPVIEMTGDLHLVSPVRPSGFGSVGVGGMPLVPLRLEGSISAPRSAPLSDLSALRVDRLRLNVDRIDLRSALHAVWPEEGGGPPGAPTRGPLALAGPFDLALSASGSAANLSLGVDADLDAASIGICGAAPDPWAAKRAGDPLQIHLRLARQPDGSISIEPGSTFRVGPVDGTIEGAYAAVTGFRLAWQTELATLGSIARCVPALGRFDGSVAAWGMIESARHDLGAPPDDEDEPSNDAGLLAWLPACRITATVECPRLSCGETCGEDLRAVVEASPRRLAARIEGRQTGGGTGAFDLAYDGQVPGGLASIAGRFDRLRVTQDLMPWIERASPLLVFTSSPASLDATVSAEGRLEGRGAARDDLLRTLAGSGRLDIGAGLLLGHPLLRAIAVAVGADLDRARLSPISQSFTVEGGRVTIAPFVVETDRIAVEISATVERDGALAGRVRVLRLAAGNPHVRRAIAFGVIPEGRISGTVGSPEVSVDFVACIEEAVRRGLVGAGVLDEMRAGPGAAPVGEAALRFVRQAFGE